MSYTSARQVNLKLNGVWNPELGNTGLQAHVDFVQKFASSAGQLLSVDSSRINVTNVRSGSIVVSFVIAEAMPAETGNGTITMEELGFIMEQSYWNPTEEELQDNVDAKDGVYQQGLVIADEIRVKMISAGRQKMGRP